jgi:hypothetical protein
MNFGHLTSGQAGRIAAMWAVLTTRHHGTLDFASGMGRNPRRWSRVGQGSLAQGGEDFSNDYWPLREQKRIAYV